MKFISDCTVPILSINVIDRARRLDMDRVEVLKAMIGETGLQHPPSVVEDGNEYRLASGWHRLEALRQLGELSIPVRVFEPETDDPDAEIRMHEVTENLGRNELNALDRATSLALLKRAYIRLHPKFKRGGDRRSKKVKDQSPIFGLSSAITDKFSLSRSAIYAAIAIYEGLHFEVRDRLHGTFLADHQAQLKKLSELDHNTQAKVLDLLLADKPQFKSVGEAVDHLTGETKKSQEDAQFTRMLSGINRMTWTEQRRFIKGIEKIIRRYVDEGLLI